MSPVTPEIPTVKGLPFLGSALSYLHAPLRMFVDSYAKHGPIFRLEFPGQSVVVIAGKSCTPFLSQNPVEGMHREGLFGPFANEVGLNVFGDQGENNEKQRAALKFPYSREMAAQFVPEMVEIVRDGAREWCAGQEIDLHSVCSELALLCAMAIVSPMDMSDELRSFSRAGNTVMFAIFNLRPKAVLKTPWYQAARNRMYAQVDEAIERHSRGDFSTRSKMHLIDAGVRAVDRKSTRAAALFALAGTEIYTGRLISFLIFELLNNREYLKGVLAEVDAAFSENDLQASTFRRMPYLRAAWHETLRYYPLLPGYPYYTSVPMNLLGFDVPKGTYVLFVPWADHFSGDYYTSPMTFDPTRCLAPRRELARNGAFAPFGVGKKTCLAPGFSEIVALTTVSTLLRHVELKLVKPSYRMSLEMAPLITPDEGIPLEVVAHRQIDPGASRAGSLDVTPDFSNLVGRELLLPVIEPEFHPEGTCLIKQGAPALDFLLIIEGSATVLCDGVGSPVRKSTLVSGDVFGETGLLKEMPSPASVVASTPVTMIRIPRDKFIELIAEFDISASDLGALVQMRYIQRLLHDSLPQLEKNVRLKDFSWKHFDPGAVVFRQGDPSDYFFIIARGSVKVTRTIAGKETDLALLEAGNFFGEVGILTTSPRSATVVTQTEVTCLCADRKTLLGIIEEHPNAITDIALALCKRVATHVTKNDSQDH